MEGHQHIECLSDKTLETALQVLVKYAPDTPNRRYPQPVSRRFPGPCALHIQERGCSAGMGTCIFAPVIMVSPRAGAGAGTLAGHTAGTHRGPRPLRVMVAIMAWRWKICRRGISHPRLSPPATCCATTHVSARRSHLAAAVRRYGWLISHHAKGNSSRACPGELRSRTEYAVSQEPGSLPRRRPARTQRLSPGTYEER